MTITSSKKVATSQGHNSMGYKVPLTSVIIPTYNHAQYLSDAIRSVLVQTYDNFEIIVVDDGSTDSTKEVVAEFGKVVRYIWQENQGLSAARNTGIFAAGGDLIGLLDADDMYEPDFLEVLVCFLKANPDADGVYCTARTINSSNNLLPQIIGKAVAPKYFRPTLLDGGFFPPLCMFAYKYCYEELGLFDRAFQGAADWDMWLRMSANYRIIGTNRVLARYRIVPNSMSHDPAHMLDNRTRVLRKHFSDESSDRSLWTPIYRRTMAHNYLRATIEYLQAGNLTRAYRYLYESFSTDPDLTTEYDVFYKLGLGAQPMGFRGDFSSLDLKANAHTLFNWLERLFQNPKPSFDLEIKQQAAYANAYLALGLLSYGKRDFTDSRQYLIQAIIANPSYILNAQLVTTLAKSLLPVRVVDWFKKRRHAPSFS